MPTFESDQIRGKASDKNHSSSVLARASSTCPLLHPPPLPPPPPASPLLSKIVVCRVRKAACFKHRFQYSSSLNVWGTTRIPGSLSVQPVGYSLRSGIPAQADSAIVSSDERKV
jgi:hypothetical protein